jgi:hypothetical protein
VRRASRFVALAVVLVAAGCDLIAGLGSPPSVDAEDASTEAAAVPVEASLEEAGFAPDDAGPTDAALDAPLVDAGLPFVSCRDVQQRLADAQSGVYPVLFGDAALPVLCDMSLDDGGWTVFFVGQVGQDNVFGHFEDDASAAALCPDAATRCLRRLPDTVTIASEFAVMCGGAALSVALPAQAFAYFRGGKGSPFWASLFDASAIEGDASPAFATAILTDEGWAIKQGLVGNPTEVFASSYSVSSAYDYCNGVSYVDAEPLAPLAELLYR